MKPKIRWYNPIGDSAYSKLDQKKKGEVRILTGRMVAGRFKTSGIMRITRTTKFGLITFLVHATMFHPNGGETDLKRHVTGPALRLMFGIHTEEDMVGNDRTFAREHGAIYGIPTVFIRIEHELSFPCPGTGLAGDPNFCIQIEHFMQSAVHELING